MEFEALVRDTNALLKDAHLYGIPGEDANGEEEEEEGLGPSTHTVAGTEHLLAERLAAAVRLAYDREGPLVEDAADCAEAAALRANVARLRMMQERVADCQTKMSELTAAYSAVTARTCSLHEACERALKNQTHLAAMAAQIKSNLHYFKQADAIFKKLSSSSSKLSVTGQSFTSLLASIDEGLHFLRSHPDWKESELYIGKYEQCLSRAMTCIRGSVMADLEAAVNDVRTRRAEMTANSARTSLADEDTLTLLYGVFASRADSVKAALSVAEARFSGVPEFEAMLAECQQVYFSTRQQLLDPILESTLSNLAVTHGDSSCTLTRSGCSFLLRVIDDEFRIYRQFFSVDERFGGAKTPGAASIRGSSPPPPATPSPSSFFWSATSSFDEFVEGICRKLYNMLRPIVIHNPHLETLTELCAILKVEMIEQRCSLMAPLLHGGTESVGGRSIVSGRGGHRAPAAFEPRGGFVRVMSELVGDIVERIIYRAETYAQSDIANYRPASGDLAYPEKLEMMRAIEEGQRKSSVVVERKESAAGGEGGEERREEEDESSPVLPTPLNNTTPSAVDLHCLWYPTVRRTVMCLAKLFKYLDMGVFQSIARELLTACCASLDTAALAIAELPKRKEGGWPRSLDAQLFVVKHLLILREQTAPYRVAAQRGDASLPTKDLSFDFAKVRNSASQLFADRGRWFELSTNNAFLEFLFQVPIQVSEPSGDSRRVIDSKLRTRCNELVEVAADLVVKQLAAFVRMAEEEASKPGFAYAKAPPSLAPKELQNVGAVGLKALNANWPLIRSAFSLYIGVAETEAILLTPIRGRVTDVWGRLLAWADKYVDDEGRAIAALPALSHIHLITRA